MPQAFTQVEALQVSLYQQGGTVQTLVTGNTINSNYNSVRISAAGAITGVIVTPGTTPGQLLAVICEQAAANTVTMAASGTSNVAAGTTCVLSGLAAHLFVWDTTTALWYQVGPATN